MKTIEEKAKAYDEALERAKAYHRGELSGSRKEMMKYIFPQLRESNDERIRKYLIEELKAAKSVGELKFIIPQPTREECIAYLEKQKEQGPAWSEDDERILRGIIGKIDHDQTYGVSKAEMLSFLKSLRPQPQGVYKQIVHSIYKILKGKDFYSMPSNCISLLNDIRVKCKDADECAEILDEPSWRPSEEQMDALAYAIQTLDDGLSPKAAKAGEELEHLREQLKKL